MRPIERITSALVPLGSLLLTLLASCAEVKPITCALAPASPMGAIPTGETAAEVFWDNSISMRAFYTKNGPYAAIGEGMEAVILPAAGIFKFKHSYVAEGVESSPRFHEPTFAGRHTDLLTAAQEMAKATQDPSRGVAILVSDLLVDTTPEQRASTDEVCGTTLPAGDERPSWHFAKCFGFGLERGVPSTAFASVVRVPLRGTAMYTLVTARSPEVGRPVVERLLTATASWGSSELRLVDTTGSDALVGEATCTSTAADPVYMGSRAPGKTPRCEFRFRKADSHRLACTTTIQRSSSGLIQSHPQSAAQEGQAAGLDETGAFQLDVAHRSGPVAVKVRTAYVPPDMSQLDPQILQFVTGSVDPAVAPTNDQQSVARVIGGLMPVLAELMPPEHSAWSIQYQ